MSWTGYLDFICASSSCSTNHAESTQKKYLRYNHVSTVFEHSLNSPSTSCPSHPRQTYPWNQWPPQQQRRLIINGKSQLFQPSKKFHLQPTYWWAALGDSKAQRLCLLGKILSRQPEKTLKTVGLDLVRVLVPPKGWERTSSHEQEKLLIFLSSIQCIWASVLPNHFSSRTGPSVRNTLLVARIHPWFSQLRQAA